MVLLGPIKKGQKPKKPQKTQFLVGPKKGPTPKNAKWTEYREHAELQIAPKICFIKSKKYTLESVLYQKNVDFFLTVPEKCARRCKNPKIEKKGKF